MSTITEAEKIIAAVRATLAARDRSHLALLAMMLLWFVITVGNTGRILPGVEGIGAVIAIAATVALMVRHRDALRLRLESLPAERVMIAMTAIAFSLRFGWVLIADTEPTSDYGTYYNLARSLANEGYFGEGGVPSAYRPFGWPALLALTQWLGSDANLGGGLLNALFSAATVVPIFYWARRLAGPAGGLLGAALWTVLPSQILMASVLATEPSFAMLIAWSLVSWTRHRDGDGRAWLIAAIVLLSLAATIRPHALVIAFGLAAAAVIRQRGDRSTVVHAALLVGLVTLSLLPWGIRNAVVLGQFSLTTTNGGVTLYLANNDNARGTYLAPEQAPAQLNGDEMERNRQGYALAAEWITSHPWRFVGLIGSKWKWLIRDERYAVRSALTSERWQASADTLQKATHFAYLLLITLALIGLLIARRLAGHGGEAALALFVTWLALHAIFHGQGRYHIPLLPMFCVFAALTLGRRDRAS